MKTEIPALYDEIDPRLRDKVRAMAAAMNLSVIDFVNVACLASLKTLAESDPLLKRAMDAADELPPIAPLPGQYL